jgi:hypothetical protein
MNSSLYYQISDRIHITRTDQICVYPRRSYRRTIRHNPYMLPVSNEKKNIKVEINDNNNELINQSE